VCGSDVSVGESVLVSVQFEAFEADAYVQWELEWGIIVGAAECVAGGADGLFAVVAEVPGFSVCAKVAGHFHV
jgi:hypothetical protein